MDEPLQSEQRTAPKALIVDDDMACVYLWRRYAKENRFCPTSATSGREAMELVQREHPALIVLDVMLPDIQG